MNQTPANRKLAPEDQLLEFVLSGQNISTAVAEEVRTLSPEAREKLVTPIVELTQDASDEGLHLRAGWLSRLPGDAGDALLERMVDRSDGGPLPGSHGGMEHPFSAGTHTTFTSGQWRANPWRA